METNNINPDHKTILSYYLDLEAWATQHGKTPAAARRAMRNGAIPYIRFDNGLVLIHQATPFPPHGAGSLDYEVIDLGHVLFVGIPKTHRAIIGLYGSPVCYAKTHGQDSGRVRVRVKMGQIDFVQWNKKAIIPVLAEWRELKRGPELYCQYCKAKGLPHQNIEFVREIAPGRAVYKCNGCQREKRTRGSR